MEKKSTPVEWLHNRLQTEPFLTNEDFEKAKAMEAERPAQYNSTTNKLFETVDCNVELPSKSGKYGVIYGDGVDSYYFHLHNIKSEKWTSDENGKHLEFPEYWLCEIPANEPHYRVIKGDEVNSIHGAAMRELNQEQLIALRDKLIRRTPPILPAPLSDADMVEFAEWVRMDGFMAVSGSDFWYHKSIRTDSKKYTTLELLQLFKTRNK